jgi:DNA modification methylase
MPKPKKNRLHLTRKPVALIERAIATAASAEILVLDVLAGQDPR